MKPVPKNLLQNNSLASAEEADKSEVVVRAAWLYFMENMTQEEIARCLGISRIKVVRLIKEAREKGIVEIKVQSPITENLRLEGEIRSLYQLTAVVVTLPEDEGEPLNKVLAWTAAQILEQRLRPGIKIGVGLGRTTSYLPDFFTPRKHIDSTFISLAGGLNSRENIDSSNETLLKLSKISGGTAKYIYAPFLVSSANIRAAIMQDKAVESVVEQAKTADLAIFSVGTPDNFALLHQYNLITAEEMAEIRSMGARGDVIGRFFDRSGEEIMTSYRDRVIGLTIDELRAIPDRVLVAGGPKKHEGILAALVGKIANILVTDIGTAEWLIKFAKEEEVGIGLK
ncbi:MAG: sugar-binding transcriptional regulator [Acidobacteriaceae bacterium]